MSRPWPPIEELRRVGQPEHIRSRAQAEHWTAHLFTRSISVYLTRLAVWAGVSANTATVLVILCGWAAAAALLVPGVWGPVLALVLALLQMVLDSIDGEIARWNRTTGPRGVFLDRIAHATAESFIPLALGLRLTAEQGEDWRWAFAGGVVAVLVLLNKALSDFVRLSRVEAGLGLPRDTPGIGEPRPGLVRTLRRVADFVPLYRMYHSVEQTIVIAVLAVVGAAAGFDGPAAALVVLGAVLPFVVVGHLTAILTSASLRNPE
ncbi:CDP-alcohol phosphatidyltransferase family protein [Phycicoccus sp. BSK3Z-2]|uniref:CDP-alcohol phosphatidyltransferase family protein n=1 Tax=Phycicoccus avicenniae TaxID=2828860 RepID=A0A941I0R4_9MICO|nr:CDP-alcohol phosphatidyltransferase family protein [Phycicoccus avicenniae]MBR7743481.1 CDP-alcohol phosphatidyltransferase family protein [Phycicoccus avicenniae]